MYRAESVMKTDVFTIDENESVEHAMVSLAKHGISGAPVVDDADRLVGVISEFQLLEAIYTPDVRKEQVSNLMTRDVFTVTENSLLSDITNLMILHRIRRVPVVREDKVVGIISRRDLLRYIVESGDTLAEFIGQDHAVAGA